MEGEVILLNERSKLDDINIIKFPTHFHLWNGTGYLFYFKILSLNIK